MTISLFKLKVRPHSANQSMVPPTNTLKSAANPKSTTTANYDSKAYEAMSPTELRILKICFDEIQRANGWVRLFPSADSWEFYSQFLETRSTGYNSMLHRKLYPRRLIFL